MKTIHIGLIGFGTVGSGTAEVLLQQLSRLQKRAGCTFALKTVVDKSRSALPAQFKGVKLSKDVEEIFNDPEIDIVVELIGGIEPAKTFLLKAIACGKHVVTANKALVSQHGKEIFDAAVEKNVEVGFEASVGGGIPLIKALKEGLVANRIESVMGIMNGTANYILSQMTDYGKEFAEVLQDAQAKGYAEADPTYDVEGIDTAHKLAIIMTMAYGMTISIDDISIEGISSIEPIDIDFAKEFGYRIKLLAITRNHGEHVEARVHPTLVPESHLLASVNGAFNAVHFHGDMVGDVLLYGQGAGQMPTGSAVVADIVDIGRNIINGAVNRVPAMGYQPDQVHSRDITPLEKLHGSYYFRMSVRDQPGVLAAIAGTLGKYGISIESVIQKQRNDSGTVPVVMRTHETDESAVLRALAEIDALDFCTAKTVKVRIMEDEHEG